MKKTILVKTLVCLCLLMSWMCVNAQQLQALVSDSRYIYPTNGELTKTQGSVEDYHDFYICRVGDKVGIVDDGERVIVPIEYDEIKHVDCGYLMRKENSWGLIDAHGEWVIPPVLASLTCDDPRHSFWCKTHDELDFFLDYWDKDMFDKAVTTLTALYNWGPYFFLRSDSTTKVISLDEYWTSGKFHDGLLPIWDKNSKKLGFLNKNGEWAIPQIIPFTEKPFMYEPAFSGGYLLLEETTMDYKTTYKIYNKKGKLLWTQKHRVGETTYSLTEYMPGGFALARVQVGNDYNGTVQWKYVSPTGQEMFPEVFAGKRYKWSPDNPSHYVRPMREGMVAFPDFSSNKVRWGFFDKSGKVIVRGKYARVHDFHDGLAAVQMPQEGENPNKWGFIDKTGKMVIPAKFSKEPQDFSEGLAVVEKNSGMQVYINKKGEVVSPQYAYASPFVNGAAFIQVYPEDYVSERFAIDHSFNVVNSYLPEYIFTTYTRAQIENAIIQSNSKDSSTAVFFYTGDHSELFNSRGEKYAMYVDDEFKIPAVTDNVVYMEYGSYYSKIDMFCDTTGKILFFLKLNEF